MPSLANMPQITAGICSSGGRKTARTEKPWTSTNQINPVTANGRKPRNTRRPNRLRGTKTTCSSVSDISLLQHLVVNLIAQKVEDLVLQMEKLLVVAHKRWARMTKWNI